MINMKKEFGPDYASIAGDLGYTDIGSFGGETAMGLLVPPNTWHSIGNDGNEDLMHVIAHLAVDVSREMKEAWTCGNPRLRNIKGEDIS